MHHNLSDVTVRLILKIAGFISEKAETVGILLFSKYYINIFFNFDFFLKLILITAFRKGISLSKQISSIQC